MRNLFLYLNFFAMSILISSCNGPNAPVTQHNQTDQSRSGKTGSGLSYDNGISQIFANRCSKCHAPGGAIPNWGDYQTVFAKKDLIYQRIIVDKSMPPPAMSTITDDERTSIGKWIQAGAVKSFDTPVADNPTPTPASTTIPKPSPVSQTDYSSIQNTIPVCTACHAADGQSGLAFAPIIFGQQAQYLENELTAFKNKSRHNKNAISYMQVPTSQLDNSSMHLLALYMSTQSWPKTKSATPPDVSAGKDLYENGVQAKGISSCVGCHGAHAEGSTIAPRLGGQHKSYILSQLAAFKEGSREEATMMPSIAKNLTEKEEDDVATYIESISP